MIVMLHETKETLLGAFSTDTIRPRSFRHVEDERSGLWLTNARFKRLSLDAFRS